MYSRVGKRIPLYCTAIGKNLMADMSELELNNYFEKTDLIPFTKHTLNEFNLRKQLKNYSKPRMGRG